MHVSSLSVFQSYDCSFLFLVSCCVCIRISSLCMYIIVEHSMYHEPIFVIINVICIIYICINKLLSCAHSLFHKTMKKCKHFIIEYCYTLLWISRSSLFHSVIVEGKKKFLKKLLLFLKEMHNSCFWVTPKNHWLMFFS